MKKLLLVGLLMLGLIFFANTQHACAALLDFAIAFPTPGTISYAGGATPLIGSGIQVDNVSDGLVTLPIVGGTLDFTTGNFSSSSTSSWFFSDGGTITLIGGVPDLGISGGTTLLSGKFTGTQRVDASGLTYKVAVTSFNDIKDETLANFVHANGTNWGHGWDGNFNLSFYAANLPPSGFTSSILASGDITNVSSTPEPSSMLLLGMGILGLFGIGRKKVKA